MNKRQKKKDRKKFYKYIISDVAMDISIDPAWREKIFSSPKNTPILISYCDPQVIPEYIRKDIVSRSLNFFVERTDKCQEKFDEGLVIFKFYSAEFPDITSYSGNNPNVI